MHNLYKLVAVHCCSGYVWILIFIFLLAQEGYYVYKLLHYGDVRNVVPYLARRALENRGAMSRAQDERILLGKEIRRKMFSLR